MLNEMFDRFFSEYVRLKITSPVPFRDPGEGLRSQESNANYSIIRWESMRVVTYNARRGLQTTDHDHEAAVRMTEASTAEVRLQLGNMRCDAGGNLQLGEPVSYGRNW